MSYTVKPRYEWQLHIDSYMVDPDCLLRPSYQLKLQQEVGERHFTEAGLGYDALIEQGMVFVLTRLCTVIRRSPRLGETVTLQTWHQGTKGAQFFRCYRFLDDRGESLIESVSAFTLVDPTTHKLLRPTVFEKFGIVGLDEALPLCDRPEKLILPPDLKAVAEPVVLRSQVDMNGHLNNTEYADLVCDYLPNGMEGRRITSLEIGYHKESRQGQTLKLSAYDDGEAVWMQGSRDGDLCFNAKMSYVRE